MEENTTPVTSNEDWEELPLPPENPIEEGIVVPVTPED